MPRSVGLFAEGNQAAKWNIVRDCAEIVNNSGSFLAVACFLYAGTAALSTLQYSTMHQRRCDATQLARGELRQIQDQARKANRRALYNKLDWFDKLQARGRRILFNAASVLRTVGPNVAGLYLLCQRRKRNYGESTHVAAHSLADRITSWADANTAALTVLEDMDHDANYVAGRWLAEWSTFRWMLHMNSKGIAPSRRALVEEYCNQFPQALLGPRARYHLDQVSVCRMKARDWAVQFRRRWGVQHRRLQAGPSLSTEEIKKKVLRSNTHPLCLCLLCSQGDAIFGLGSMADRVSLRA